MVERSIGDKFIRLVTGDITEQDVEAFVYDITADVQLGFGYGSAISSRAGKSVQEELDSIGSCPSGQAIVTSAGNLKAKYIIHTNGPKFFEPNEEAILRHAVESVLKLAEEKGITQLAFPPIGTGLYQVDQALSARVLVDTVTEHLKNSSTIREVLFVALDTREFKPFQKEIQKGV